MTELTWHPYPSSRAELIENLAVGAVYAFSADGSHGSTEDAARAFIDLDDELIVKYLRTVVLISRMAGAQLYMDVWPSGEPDDPDTPVDVAREYLRALL